MRVPSKAVILTLALAATLDAASLGGEAVEDDNGSPLASVDVRLSRSGQARLVADLDTDASGHFSVPSLAPGEYRLELSKANFIGVNLTFTVSADSDTISHQFRLIRGAAISGQATDAQGRPIQGGFVYAMPKPAEGDSFRPFAQAMNGPSALSPLDSNGHYRLYNLPPGQYAVVLAWGATRQRAAQSGGSTALTGLGTGIQFYPSNSAPVVFPISGGEQLQANFLINSSTTWRVTGKVDRELKPNEGRYWLALVLPQQPGLAIAAAQTEPSGAFSFEGIAAGTYDLLASGPSRGYGGGGGILEQAPLFARSRVTVSGQNVEGLVVSPSEGRSLPFVVKRTDNTCPDAAELTLNSLEDWTVVLTATHLIGPVPQTVEHLAPARYRATAAVAGDACFATPRTFTVGDDKGPIEMTVSPGGSIRGTLHGAANASLFLAVLSDPESPAEAVRVAHPDGAGTFAFTGLRPGRYRIAAVPTAEMSQSRWVADDAHTTIVNVTGGAPVNVELTAPAASPQ